MSEKPMLGGCCVCLDERGWAENPLVYCDGQACNVAVHQACYGIVKVPSGPWFCRKCESQERAAKVKCELCPHRDGALKRTDGGGWAHVVCALYVPEVTFGSVSSMEPILLQKVPPDRFSKTCYICEEENRSSKATTGACMTCAKPGCKGTFHVTCAQMAGLLCEEASGGNQTKYCGYCKTHLAKIKKTSSFKSLSCTKVYKLPTTSSSDELASPERTHCNVALEPSMKPGHIRYTKAGKKRSKSLEDSLGIDTSTTEVASSVDTIIDRVAASSGAPTTQEHAATPPPQPVSLADLQSSPVPIVSVEPLSMKPGVKFVHSPSKSAPPEKSTTAPKSDVKVEVAEKEQLVAPATFSSQAPPLETGGAGTLTLLSLAETASTLSQSSSADGGEVAKTATAKPVEKAAQNKTKTAKEPGQKKRNKDGKKTIRAKSKKDFPADSKHKDSANKNRKNDKAHSTVAPHKPVPPSRTATSVPDDGVATFPRHSVVSLANMGAERMETYEAHEIGDNNKIIKPDLSVDGVTALEHLLEEQKHDTMDFFSSYGTTPEVAALIQALHSVREENSQLQSAIEQMSRRRDQLSLIKTRLSGLQTNSVSSASSSSTHSTNIQQTQAPTAHPPPAAYGTVISSPPPVPQQQHGYLPQQPISYPHIPVYTSVTSK